MSKWGSDRKRGSHGVLMGWGDVIKLWATEAQSWGSLTETV